MSLDLLGQAQVMHNQTDSAVIRDPFSCTLYGFISFSLRELSKALHRIVVYTQENLIVAQQKKYFFLVGYKPRQGWNTLQQKIYGNPRTELGGQDIKWLLKNLRWHYKKYTKYLALDKETFDDITGFLLFDVVLNGFTCGDNESTEYDDSLTIDCFNASIDFLSAVVEASSYKAIKEDVGKIKHNLEAMVPVVLEFKSLILKQASKLTDDLETGKVFNFLKSKSLLNALEKERKVVSDNPTEKPITNYFLYTVIPRFESLNLTVDSGVVADISLANETMDGSMIVIGTPKNQKSVVVESTPVLKNKSVERLKRSSSSQKKTPVKSYSQKKVSHPKSPDEMDGSFVLI